MTLRRSLAYGSLATSAVALLTGVALVIADKTPLETVDGDLPFVSVFLLWGVLGTVLAVRVPSNPIGWLFCGLTSVTEWTFLARAYGEIPDAGGRAYAAWFAGWAADWISPLLLVLILLLFPSGRLNTRVGRLIAWSMAGVALVASVAAAMAPGKLPYNDSGNPFGVESLDGLTATVEGFARLTLALIFVAVIVTMFVRVKRSKGVERQQFKWFFLAAAGFAFNLVLASITSALGSDSDLGNLLGAALALLSLAGLAFAMTFAVLRYRLYEIDVLVNRALVYTTITGTLAIIYLALVFGLQTALEPITRDSDLAVGASTLGVAALFGPLRTRTQAFVDRRFYRRKYDARRTLTTLTRTLRDQVEIETVQEDVLRAVQETVQPVHATLWLRPS